MFRLRGFSPPCRFAPREVCRSVAPCSRSWASLRLAHALRHTDPTQTLRSMSCRPNTIPGDVIRAVHSEAFAFLATHHPSKFSPHQQLLRVTALPCPLAVAETPFRSAFEPLVLRTEVQLPNAPRPAHDAEASIARQMKANTYQPGLVTETVRGPLDQRAVLHTVESHSSPRKTRRPRTLSRCRSTRRGPPAAEATDEESWFQTAPC
jgi:hypothetical protein